MPDPSRTGGSCPAAPLALPRAAARGWSSPGWRRGGCTGAVGAQRLALVGRGGVHGGGLLVRAVRLQGPLQDLEGEKDGVRASGGTAPPRDRDQLSSAAAGWGQTSRLCPLALGVLLLRDEAQHFGNWGGGSSDGSKRLPVGLGEERREESSLAQASSTARGEPSRLRATNQPNWDSNVCCRWAGTYFAGGTNTAEGDRTATGTSGGMLSSESELSSQPLPSKFICRSWSMVASTAPLLALRTHSIMS